MTTGIAVINTEKTEAVARLQALIGQKVTVWSSGEFGFGSAYKGRLETVTIADYAQHRDVIWLTIKRYRKRYPVREILLPYRRVAIWIGWHEVDTNKWEPAEDVGVNMTWQRSKYLSHSPEWLTQALKSVPVEPVYVQCRVPANK